MKNSFTHLFIRCGLVFTLFIGCLSAYGQCSVDYLSASFTNEHLKAIYFIDANTGFIGGMNESILKTTDGGKNWYPTKVSKSQYGGDIYAFSFGSALVGYAVGNSYSPGMFRHAIFLKTTDGGNTWNDIPSTYPGFVGNSNNPSYSGVYAKDANIVYAVGYEGKIIKSLDGGANWTTIKVALNNSLSYNDITFTGPSTARLAASDGMNVTTDDFATTLTTATNAKSNSAHFPTATTGYSVGNAGAIYKTTNGTTWAALTSGSTKILRDVFFTDATHGVAVGFAGTILRTTDGTTFSTVASATTVDLFSVWFTSANTGYIVGDSGTILQTSDGGLTWKNINKIALPYNTAGYSFAIPTAAIGYYGLENASIAKTTDGGSTWTSSRITVPAGVNGANADDSGISAMYFTDVNNGVVATITNPQSSLDAAVGGSSIYRTTDGGTSWTEAIHTGKMSGSSISITDIDFGDANNGWAVGLFGSTYRTTNGGQSWSFRMNTPGGVNESLRKISIGGTTAYTLSLLSLYKNAGAGWTTLTSPLTSYSGIDFISDNAGWVGGANGSIPELYKTTDGGVNWTKITLPPMGANSLIYDVKLADSNNGFLSTDKWIYKTTDGGASWTAVVDAPGEIALVSNNVGYSLQGNKLVRFSCVTPCPRVIDFTPTIGTAGTQVVLTGTNLSSVGQVTFNGADASFTINSATQLTATAPVGVTTGDVLVYAQLGACASGVKNSPLFTTPTLNAAPFNLTAYTAIVGTPSATQTITVSGTALSANTILTPPANFEVSLSSTSGFTSSLSLPPASGALAATIVYIRYNPAAGGSHSGNVVVSSSGAGNKNIAVSGTATMKVSSIVVTGAGNATTISTNAGTLQMSAAVLPAGATDKSVTWSVINGTGSATVNTSGLVTAVANGTVTIKAIANDGSTNNGTAVLTISNQIILVSSIVVTGAGNATTISTDDGTLQMSAAVSPASATNKTVTWSVISGTGSASVNASGLVTALTNGTVTIKATANDGSTNNGTVVLTISNQIVLVSSITVTGAGNATTISVDDGTLQMSAAVSPASATNKTVTWSVINGTGSATVNASGLVTALTNGTVTIKATANDGSTSNGTIVLTLSNQIVLVSSIVVTGAGNVTTISTNAGKLQMSAAVSPASATNKTVTWSVINGTGSATVNASGLVTAVINGTVTIKATANDGSNNNGTIILTLSNQIVLVNSIVVTGVGNATAISINGGTLQMSAAISPALATNKTVTWSVNNGTGSAEIDASGMLTATGNGIVTVKATANDGSLVNGTKVITISGQPASTLVTSITVSGADIAINDGTAQMTAKIFPANATVKSVTWSIADGTGSATISSSGLVTATANGTVTVTALANDVSTVTGTKVLTISNQIVPVSFISVTEAGNQNTISIPDGTLQMIANVLPLNATDNTVTWSVINQTGSALISNTGLLTAKGNGTVVVKASANDGSEITGVETVIITGQPIFIPVTSISIAGDNIAPPATTSTMTATVTPSNASVQSVTWSIADGTGRGSIDTVTGEVTAIQPGTVIVTALANDLSGSTQSKAICLLPATPVITVSFANPETPLLTSSGTLGNQWFLNDNAIGGANDMNYVARESGDYTLQVAAGTCLSSKSEKQAIMVTGLEEEEGSLLISCYPNPSDESITLRVIGTGIVKVVVYNTSGQLMSSGGAELIDHPIGITHYPAGLYFARVWVNEKNTTLKFIKK